jgi:hypothetical protein
MTQMIQNPHEVLKLIHSGLTTRQTYQLSRTEQPQRYIQILSYWYAREQQQFFELDYRIEEPLTPALISTPVKMRLVPWPTSLQDERRGAAQTLQEWRERELWQKEAHHVTVCKMDGEPDPDIINRIRPPHIAYIYSQIMDLLKPDNPLTPALAQLTMQLEDAFPDCIEPSF